VNDKTNDSLDFEYENKVESIKNGYQLTMNHYKIKITNPVIQLYQETRYVDRNDIMRFQYDVEILTMREDGKFKRLLKHCVSEFGIMSHVEAFIDNILAYDIKQFASKRKELKDCPLNNAKEYHQFFNIAGFLDEDRMDVVATYREFDDSRGHHEFITYEVAFFIGGDEYGSPIVGIKLTDLEKEDLLDIKDLATLFMEYAENIAKQEAAKLKKYYDDLEKGIVGPNPYD
jgi:hypothetical protein